MTIQKRIAVSFLVFFNLMALAPVYGNAASYKLNGPLVTNGDVSSDFTISTDSSRVVYRADQETEGVFELYSVPIGGGSVTKLNDTLVSGGDVDQGFAISADSSRVVYLADQDTDEVFELYGSTIGSPSMAPVLLLLQD